MKKRVLTFIKKTCVWTLPSIGMLVAFSCQDDLGSERESITENAAVKFTLFDDSICISRSVKSSSPVSKETRHFLTVIGKDSIFLHTKIEENDATIFDNVLNTRAASHNTNRLTSFYLTAFVEDGSEFMKQQPVEKQNGEWEYSPLKYWPQEQAVHFYGYVETRIQVGEESETVYPATPPIFTPITDDKGYQGTFSHSLPHPNTVDYRDAERQPDLIFTMTPNQGKANNPVQLKFYHALSAIVFKVGNMPEETKITNISVADVKGNGSCTMTAVTGGGINFAWTSGEDSETKTYTQTFNKEEVEENQIISEDNTTFMMIPQELTDKAHLVINFSIGERDYSYQHPLIIKDEDGNVISSEWEANKKYTYALSTTEVVEVEVTDHVSGDKNTVKDEVKIQNTGLTPSYIRVAIVGFWVNESGDIVASWTDKDDVGKFTNLCGANWIKAQDGFYYHKEIVTPGNYASTLFEKYELTGNPPLADVSLVLNIVVQAVDVNTTMPWEAVVVSNGVLTEK